MFRETERPVQKLVLVVLVEEQQPEETRLAHEVEGQQEAAIPEEQQERAGVEVEELSRPLEEHPGVQPIPLASEVAGDMPDALQVGPPPGPAIQEVTSLSEGASGPPRSQEGLPIARPRRSSRKARRPKKYEDAWIYM